MANQNSAKGNPIKCKGLGCNNDAIGVVGRDPYNERILDALEFVMREVK